MPQIFYVVSIQGLNSHLENKFLYEIKKIYLGDTEKLLNGSVDIKNEINKNVNHYLKQVKLISWGVKLSPTISSKHGQIIYPMIYGKDELEIQLTDQLYVAAENYNLLTQGFTINVNVELRHNSFLTNLIILFYVVIFFLISLFYFKRINKDLTIRDNISKTKMNKLVEKVKEYEKNLYHLQTEKNTFHSQLVELKRNLEEQKNDSDHNEEELINEIIRLEEELNKNIMLQKEHEQETEHLKKEIESLNNLNRIVKNVKSENKRFQSIYKNLHFNDRAIKGFLNLSENLRIKSEKIIHELNDSPGIVKVKRRVFTGKNGGPILEAIFGRKGRLYFRNGNKIEILVIGTKNSQYKDMEYLRKL